MVDLIDRQAAMDAIENTECELLPEEWDELIDSIMNVPSADVQPVRHGYWGILYDDFQSERICSSCSNTIALNAPAYPRCPYCGAWMHERDWFKHDNHTGEI